MTENYTFTYRHPEGKIVNVCFDANTYMDVADQFAAFMTHVFGYDLAVDIKATDLEEEDLHLPSLDEFAEADAPSDVTEFGFNPKTGYWTFK